MPNMTSDTNSLSEEGSIDRDRIIDGHLVPEEYFCPICQSLLWKPRSCASCQHLFCEKCIQTWIENANSRNRCPFRCELFEERRCPPYVQSILSRLNIRCRNASFGCTEILSYNSIEHHENIECKYLSRKCSECDKTVLVTKLAEHREFPGLCVPCPIKCTICQDYVEKSLFIEHFHQCCERRIRESLRRAGVFQMPQTGTNDEPTTANTGMALIQSLSNSIQLFEQQKQFSRLPTTLKGVDAIRRAREQNCGHIHHVLLMLRFILLNWSKAPFLLFSIPTGAFFAVGAMLLGVYMLFCHWVYKHIQCGPVVLILFTCLISYGTSIFLQLILDRTIIFCVGMFLLISGCLFRTPLEAFEMHPLFNKPWINVFLCCAGVLSMKVILLFIRFYYWAMPIYLATGILTFIHFLLGFQLHLVYAKTIRETTNQPFMNV